MTTVNSFLLLSFRQFAFSNCSGNYLWFSFDFEYTTISYSHLMNDSRHWCGFFSQFSCSGRKKMALARRYNKWIANIKLYTPSHFSKVYKIEILQPVYQQVAVKMGQVWYSLFLLLNLFVCLFVFLLCLLPVCYLIGSFSTPPPTGPRVCSPWCACKRRWTSVLSPWIDRNGTESQTGLSRYCYLSRTGTKWFLQSSNFRVS